MAPTNKKVSWDKLRTDVLKALEDLGGECADEGGFASRLLGELIGMPDPKVLGAPLAQMERDGLIVRDKGAFPTGKRTYAIRLSTTIGKVQEAAGIEQTNGSSAVICLTEDNAAARGIVAAAEKRDRELNLTDMPVALTPADVAADATLPEEDAEVLFVRKLAKQVLDDALLYKQQVANQEILIKELRQQVKEMEGVQGKKSQYTKDLEKAAKTFEDRLRDAKNQLTVARDKTKQTATELELATEKVRILENNMKVLQNELKSRPIGPTFQEHLSAEARKELNDYKRMMTERPRTKG